MIEEEGNTEGKLYYTISEVAEMLQMSVSNVRYYENEFDTLRVRKDSKGNRLFTRANIDTLRQIIYLTKEEGYTLEGAKKALKQREQSKNREMEALKVLRELRNKLSMMRDKVKESMANKH